MQPVGILQSKLWRLWQQQFQAIPDIKQYLASRHIPRAYGQFSRKRTGCICIETMKQRGNTRRSKTGKTCVCTSMEQPEKFNRLP
ncbi:hypothetical protein AA3271_1583 [Gluconobacter japonicus NBRC 3271]|nr:hypothetical protein AA3271_1583 [Gluconobacter japonicus NBRC 3271]